MVTKGQSADHPKFLWSNTGHYFQGQPKQRPDSLIDENFWKQFEKLFCLKIKKKNNSGSDWSASGGEAQWIHPDLL